VPRDYKHNCPCSGHPFECFGHPTKCPCTNECEMCASSKWKNACPECDGTEKITMSEKIKYWWSEDRQFFCILVNDGAAQATVSLDRDEALLLSLFADPPTPESERIEDEAWQRVKKMLDDRRAAVPLPAGERDPA